MQEISAGLMWEIERDSGKKIRLGQMQEISAGLM
jgi:hypothetical protein